MAVNPNSEVFICNMAFGLLGQGPITSINSPATTKEQIAAQWYHAARRYCLANHDWNFAKKRQVLAQLSSTPAFEYNAEYQLPVDYVRLTHIGEDFAEEVDHSIEDGKILINDPAEDEGLSITYIYDLVNVVQMNPMFHIYFAHELAIMLSPSFKDESVSFEKLMIRKDACLARAKSIDGSETKPKLVYRSNMVNARDSVGTI